ncbi:MAG: ABC-type Fe3+-hydroxamate transport system substrate-binding protein [Cyclobacteriaceae bacterium]|jgi:ABC-type Fe3+-hydroxamate transport system substrate-binding protein
MENRLLLEKTPVRVVSLVPSITEYLIDLGVHVIGRTKFCVHPVESVQNITVIGGTKNFRFSMIDQLEPDLIIGNKEENYQEGITRLKASFPVWMSDINSPPDAVEMMRSLSVLLDRQVQGEILTAGYQKKLEEIKGTESGSVLYLIWQNPYMAAGKKTYINSFLIHQGYDNVVQKARYPEITADTLAEIQPDHILLSSEPFPFKSVHIEALRQMLPNANIRLVNGEFYSWYGSRLAKLKDETIV